MSLKDNMTAGKQTYSAVTLSKFNLPMPRGLKYHDTMRIRHLRDWSLVALSVIKLSGEIETYVSGFNGLQNFKEKEYDVMRGLENPVDRLFRTNEIDNMLERQTVLLKQDATAINNDFGQLSFKNTNTTLSNLTDGRFDKLNFSANKNIDVPGQAPVDLSSNGATRAERTANHENKAKTKELLHKYCQYFKTQIRKYPLNNGVEPLEENIADRMLERAYFAAVAAWVNSENDDKQNLGNSFIRYNPITNSSLRGDLNPVNLSRHNYRQFANLRKELIHWVGPTVEQKSMSFSAVNTYWVTLADMLGDVGKESMENFQKALDDSRKYQKIFMQTMLNLSCTAINIFAPFPIGLCVTSLAKTSFNPDDPGISFSKFMKTAGDVCLGAGGIAHIYSGYDPNFGVDKKDYYNGDGSFNQKAYDEEVEKRKDSADLSGFQKLFNTNIFQNLSYKNWNAGDRYLGYAGQDGNAGRMREAGRFKKVDNVIQELQSDVISLITMWCDKNTDRSKAIVFEDGQFKPVGSLASKTAILGNILSGSAGGNAIREHIFGQLPKGEDLVDVKQITDTLNKSITAILETLYSAYTQTMGFNIDPKVVNGTMFGMIGNFGHNVDNQQEYNQNIEEFRNMLKRYFNTLNILYLRYIKMSCFPSGKFADAIIDMSKRRKALVELFERIFIANYIYEKYNLKKFRLPMIQYITSNLKIRRYGRICQRYMAESNKNFEEKQRKENENFEFRDNHSFDISKDKLGFNDDRDIDYLCKFYGVNYTLENTNVDVFQRTTNKDKNILNKVFGDDIDCPNSMYKVKFEGIPQSIGKELAKLGVSFYSSRKQSTKDDNNYRSAKEKLENKNNLTSNQIETLDKLVKDYDKKLESLKNYYKTQCIGENNNNFSADSASISLNSNTNMRFNPFSLWFDNLGDFYPDQFKIPYDKPGSTYKYLAWAFIGTEYQEEILKKALCGTGLTQKDLDGKYGVFEKEQSFKPDNEIAGYDASRHNRVIFTDDKGAIHGEAKNITGTAGNNFTYEYDNFAA